MHPDWREMAKRHEAELGKPQDEEADRKTVAQIRGRVDAARVIPDQGAPLTGEDADYFLMSRWVPATKGKWRMVSQQDVDRQA